MRDLIYMESFIASAIAIGKGSHTLERVIERLEAAHAELRTIKDPGAFTIGVRAMPGIPANDCEPRGRLTAPRR